MLKILLAIPVKYMTYKGIFKPVGDPPTGFKSKKFSITLASPACKPAEAGWNFIK